MYSSSTVYNYETLHVDTVRRSEVIFIGYYRDEFCLSKPVLIIRILSSHFEERKISKPGYS